MNRLTYVTSNYGKKVSIEEHFQKEEIPIDYYVYDFDEPDINDICVISKEKARQAYEIMKSLVFAADTGFYIEDYPNHPNYPGAFVKRSGIASNIDQLLITMKKVKNRNCYFLDCLTYYDGDEYQQFLGISKGTLAYEKRGSPSKKMKSNLWLVFIPNNCSKTLAEMTDYERKTRDDDRTSATDEFIKWYKNNYSNSKVLKNSDFRVCKKFCVNDI